MKHFSAILLFAVCIGSPLMAQTPYDFFSPATSRPILSLEATSPAAEEVESVDSDLVATQIVDDVYKWLSVDPLSDKYPSISPYAYCAWNPIGYLDPDGKSTKVVKNEEGTYTVIGGNLKDNDLNIYEYSKDKNGDYSIRGNSIGITTSITSFYNSDAEKWDGEINPADKSGQAFFGKIYANEISLREYIKNGTGKKLYDFKYSNGTADKSDDGKDVYRGMPFGQTPNGTLIFTSARDMGNIAAGYIAGSNGFSWEASRLAFDGLQTLQDKRPSIEGISSRNAQYFGWCLGYTNNTPAQQSRNLLNSFKFW